MTHTPPLPQRIPRSIIVLGILGLLLFFVVQILPGFISPPSEGNAERSAPAGIISKEAAEAKAAQFAKRQFGLAAGDETPHAVHQSDSLLYGYLAKNKKLAHFEQTYDGRFPTDTMQTEVKTPSGALFVYVHLETGRIVGWRLFPADKAVKKKAPYYSDWSKLQLARNTAVQQGGFRLSELKDGQVNGSQVVFRPQGYAIGDAQLAVRVTVEPLPVTGQLKAVQYRAAFAVPDHYAAYIQKQKNTASALSLYGSLLMNLLLFIAAIVFAIRRRRSTSLLRGLLLTALFLAFYIANNFNMADGIRASYGARPDVETLTAAGIVVSNIFTVLMGIGIYFCLVGGDGLWRGFGQRLWARYGEAGYGDHVWRSMKLSYPLAFVLLGAQSVLLFGLDRSIGSWSTTSVESSPYNLALPLLYPLLAWCAAISEEAMYRLFGIALFKKLLRRQWLAYLVPTVIWALGHVSYPVYPFYSRLIELTIVGLLFCVLFVRYGFITAVFTHAMLDTVLMSFNLLQLGTPVNLLAAAVYLVLPVGIAWLLRSFANRSKAARV